MLNYLIRRLFIGAITLLVITFLIFALIRNIPGTPLTFQIGESDPSEKQSEEDIKQMKAAYGLDKPWPVAYMIWLKNTVKGDLGVSFSRSIAVTELIKERIGPTMLLSVSSLLLAYFLAIPMGLFSTVRSGNLEERTLSTVLYMLYSFPSFVAALLLQIFFTVNLQGTRFELPLMDMVSDGYGEFTTWEKTWDIFKHMLLPVTCYTYASLAYYSRFIKSNMQEVIRQDFIRTARAKGVGPVRVVWHHAFRNTLIPFVTLLGMTLPSLLGGSVILERIFVWPGMGQLFFSSILERDYPTIMGLTLLFSTLTLAGQLLADILYSIVDPRITYH